MEECPLPRIGVTVVVGALPEDPPQDPGAPRPLLPNTNDRLGVRLGLGTKTKGSGGVDTEDTGGLPSIQNGDAWLLTLLLVLA